MKKILVTSGGTKVPIDCVRSITNMSSGTFGSKIATELLKLGHQVIFLKAKGSKTPFTFTFDIMDDPDCFNKATEVKSLYISYQRTYREYQYQTFENYKEQLEKLIKSEKPDTIVLAAAVSDYGVKNYVEGKIRSKDNLTIELEPLPKIISMVKEWAPNAKLVGFKLLVNSDEQELIEAARKSIDDNGCDMVVANDLRDIKNNDHIVHLVYKNLNSTISSKSENPNFIARIVSKSIASL